MMIRTDRNKRLIALYVGPEERSGAAGLEPLAEESWPHVDGLFMKVPWTDAAVEALAGCGAPGSGWSAFNRDYDPPLVEGRYAPMPHQLETAAFLAAHPRAYCTSTMRTGKTASVVMAFDYLYRRGDANAALVVCPVSVMNGVWARTFRETLPDLEAVVVRGDARKREKLLGRSAAVYVVNYDGLKGLEIPLREMLGVGGNINAVVIDELSHYGNPSTARWKVANRLFNPSKGPGPRYLWALTGTPGADVMSVFGFAHLVNPAAMPWKVRLHWQSAVQYHYGTEAWMWRDRPTAPETVKSVLQPNIRFSKDEVLKDLPPVVRTRLEAPLSAEQTRMFEGLKREMLALTRSGKLVTADVKAGLVSKLFQTAAGGVIADGGACARVDCGPRNALILKLVRDNPRKTVIFCAFRGVVDALAEYLHSEGVPTVCVHGSVTGAARDRAFESFQNSDEYRAMVAHPVTTAYGTELAAADQLIINGPLLSGTHTYMQGLERLSSAKQTSGQVNVVEIVCSEEEGVFMDSLDKRTGQAEATARLFEFVTGGEGCPTTR
jgi:hypothetical protein